MVILLPLYLVDPNGGYPIQAPVLQTPIDDVLDRTEHLLPGGLKACGNFCPGQYLCPTRKKLHIRPRQLMLAIAPGDVLDFYATCGAIHAAHRIKGIHRNAPERNKLEAARLVGTIVSRCGLKTARADRRRSFPSLHLNLDAIDAAKFGQSHRPVNKTLEFLTVLQDGLHKHLLVSRSWYQVVFATHPIPARTGKCPLIVSHSRAGAPN